MMDADHDETINCGKEVSNVAATAAAAEADLNQQQMTVGSEREEEEEMQRACWGGACTNTHKLFVACGIGLVVSSITAIGFLDIELFKLLLGTCTIASVLFANALALSYIRQKGYSVLLVLLVELTVLCLPFVLLGKDPLMLLPPAVVFLLYLVLLFPLDYFQEKMLAIRAKSESTPSPRRVLILDRLCHCLLWLFLVVTIVGSIVASFYLISDFVYYTNQANCKYSDTEYNSNNSYYYYGSCEYYRDRLTDKIWEFIIGFILLSLSCCSMLYLIGMVFRNLNPLRSSATERRAKKSEQRAAKLEEPKSRLWSGLRKETVARNENEVELNIV